MSTTKKRLLILGKLPPPLMGPAIATQILINSSLNKRYDLQHFDTRINRSLAEMGRFKWSKLAAVARHYRNFREVLRDFKPHLVLIPISQTAVGYAKDAAFIRLSARSGATTLIQLRGSAFYAWSTDLNKVGGALLKKSLADANGAIVLGENLKGQFAAYFKPERIFVVPNGGDFQFPEKEKTDLRLLYLANFLPGKGLLEVLKALQILGQKPDLPSFEFHAYGAWDNEIYRKECQVVANQLPAVWIHPPVAGDLKWKAFADADIFIFAPRDPEGHPWSIVEALAAGLPIVSTDRGAIAQSVIDGENGFLLADPIPDQIADSLKRLITEPILREKMGRSSKALYEASFTAEKMVEKYADVFETVLDACELIEN